MSPSSPATFRYDQPYRAIAGEIISDFLALAALVEARRPEIAGIPGIYHMAVDAAAGTIIFGKMLENGSIVLVERILVDPQSPATFGASELPIVVKKDSVQH